MNVVTLQQPQKGSFDAFWLAYPRPRRMGKLMAQAKWDKIVSGDGLYTRIFDRSTEQYMDVHLKASPEEIIAGTQAWEKTIRKPNTYSEYIIEPRYMPLPATFLNQGRWLDYL